MKIFLDSEFTGLHKDTTLISIGLIAEDTRSFYAEFDDYDKSQVDEWIEDNVIENLFKDKNDGYKPADVVVYGNKDEISKALNEWLDDFDDTIEWVSDVSHYDFVLLIDLLVGDALKLPKYISAVCHDINQDIAEYCGISEIDAFDYSREEFLLDKFGRVMVIEGRKHNAIYDALVIMQIYYSILKEKNNGKRG